MRVEKPFVRVILSSQVQAPWKKSLSFSWFRRKDLDLRQIVAPPKNVPPLGAKDPQRAVDLWSEALSLAMETGNAAGIFHVATALGSTLAQAGEKQESRKLLELAVEVGLKLGFPQVAQVQAMLSSLE